MTWLMAMLLVVFMAGVGVCGGSDIHSDVPVTITVKPYNPNIDLGTSYQFTATLVMPSKKDTTRDVTSLVSWSSSNSSIATIDNETNTKGLATPVSVGTTTITAALGAISGSTTLTVGPTANLPKTGMTTSYTLGDDGDLQRGIAWPSPRFTTNADTTITDNLTGLIWTSDGNAPDPGGCKGGPGWEGPVANWFTALDYVACLNSNNYLGHNDWRLPNRKELRSLINYGQADSNDSWLNGQGFSNVQYYYYWSSTTVASLPWAAWYVTMGAGRVYPGSKACPEGSCTGVVWPVRGGDEPFTAPAKLSKTGQATIYATGDDGDLQKGAAWPSPRFTNPDGTMPVAGSVVVDRLTRLMWPQDGNAPGPVSCSPATTKTWQEALNYITCLNANSFLGYSDWRLPNINELESLINAEQANPASWLNEQGFRNVLATLYWSSTAFPYGNAWYADLANSQVDGANSYWLLGVLPVRSGQ